VPSGYIYFGFAIVSNTLFATGTFSGLEDRIFQLAWRHHGEALEDSRQNLSYMPEQGARLKQKA